MSAVAATCRATLLVSAPTSSPTPTTIPTYAAPMKMASAPKTIVFEITMSMS
jgi:hypothetical protein